MRTLSPPQFQELLREPGVQLLDVRMPEEADIACLPGGALIPVHELPRRVAELSAERPVAIYCHHGVRSEHAALVLEVHGFGNVAHLDGGIDAWSVEIDPSLPRY
ncbi:MAG: rhodanese-like domain-containing protein [Panacagrimonas sp.]